MPVPHAKSARDANGTPGAGRSRAITATCCVVYVPAIGSSSLAQPADSSSSFDRPSPVRSVVGKFTSVPPVGSIHLTCVAAAVVVSWTRTFAGLLPHAGKNITSSSETLQPPQLPVMPGLDGNTRVGTPVVSIALTSASVPFGTAYSPIGFASATLLPPPSAPLVLTL